MTQRRDLLRGVEQQLLALVALPGQPVGASSLAGPRHLFRLVDHLLQDGDPEPLVGLDADGDVQCRWFLGDAEMTLVVDDGGSGWLWARREDETELAYDEWGPGSLPVAALAVAGELLRRPATTVLPSGATGDLRSGLSR